MRISDWSSDVCSSDLTPAIKAGEQRCESTYIKGCYTAPPRSIGRLQNCVIRIKASEAENVDDADAGNGKRTGHHCPEGDRKRDVKGQGWSVRLGLGGRRFIKKKKRQNTKQKKK